MSDISKMRDDIDKIDSKIIALLEERFSLSREIGRYKKMQNLPVFDEKREKNIIENIGIKVKDESITPCIISIYHAILSRSKDLQE